MARAAPVRRRASAPGMASTAPAQRRAAAPGHDGRGRTPPGAGTRRRSRGTTDAGRHRRAQAHGGGPGAPMCEAGHPGRAATGADTPGAAHGRLPDVGVRGRGPERRCTGRAMPGPPRTRPRPPAGGRAPQEAGVLWEPRWASDAAGRSRWSRPVGRRRGPASRRTAGGGGAPPQVVRKDGGAGLEGLAGAGSAIRDPASAAAATVPPGVGPRVRRQVEGAPVDGQHDPFPGPAALEVGVGADAPGRGHVGIGPRLRVGADLDHQWRRRARRRRRCPEAGEVPGVAAVVDPVPGARHHPGRPQDLLRVAQSAPAEVAGGGRREREVGDPGGLAPVELPQPGRGDAPALRWAPTPSGTANRVPVPASARTVGRSRWS